MQKKLQEFYTLLQQNKIEADDIELVETLWLAEQIAKQNKIKKTSQWYKNIINNIQNHYNEFKKLLNYIKINKKQKSINKIQDETNTTLKLKKRKKISKKIVPLSAFDKGQKRSLPFRTPVNRYFQNDNNWIYALRHFRKKIPSKHYFILDEEKTADYIANTNIFNLQFKPKFEKQFKATFIVDISESMQIWQEMIDEFLQNIKNYNIFKNLDIYFLDTMEEDVSCYKSKDKIQKIKLLNFSKDTLVFIMSDMYAKGWQNIKFLYTIYQWQTKTPLCIVQMLPFSLWKATILNRTTLTLFKSNKIFPKNKYLNSRIRIKNTNDTIMKIPILNFDTTSFDAYGRVMNAKPKNRINGAIFNLSKLKEKRNINNLQVLNSKQRVRKFYESASEPAKKLAEYLSVVPLKFQIMKIVQQKLLLNPSQVYLSEVFMSPLINRDSNINGIYSFYKNENEKEGVRDILMSLLGTSKAIDTIITISNFIEKREGAFDFLSFLNNPSSIEKSKEYDEIDREFARISVKILENMGGEYAKLAQTLTKYIDDYEEIEEDEVETIIPTSKRFMMGSNNKGLNIKKQPLIHNFKELFKDNCIMYLSLKENITDLTGNSKSIDIIKVKNNFSHNNFDINGLRLDGNTVLQINNNLLPFNKAPRSFSMWVKFENKVPNKIEGYKYDPPKFLFSYGEEQHGKAFGLFYGIPFFNSAFNNDYGFRVFTWCNPLLWEQGNHECDSNPFGTAISAKWYHVYISYDGQYFKCYINNKIMLHEEKDISTTPSKLINIGGFIPGKEKNYYRYCFDGYIREFIAFNKVLNKYEINTLYIKTAPYFV